MVELRLYTAVTAVRFRSGVYRFTKDNTMKEVEIVLCPDCKGKGEIHTDILIDYHKRDYDTKVETCKRCNGSGRLRKITEVKYEAFKS